MPWGNFLTWSIRTFTILKYQKFGVEKGPWTKPSSQSNKLILETSEEQAATSAEPFKRLESPLLCKKLRSECLVRKFFLSFFKFIWKAEWQGGRERHKREILHLLVYSPNRHNCLGGSQWSQELPALPCEWQAQALGCLLLASPFLNYFRTAWSPSTSSTPPPHNSSQIPSSSCHAAPTAFFPPKPHEESHYSWTQQAEGRAAPQRRHLPPTWEHLGSMPSSAPDAC